ncbi:MAG: class I SAM-dependent methyltransferase [Gemmataceae bacterium]
MLRDIGVFLGRYLRQPSVIGAIVPSSRHLAASMLKDLDLPQARAVIEYGPGTGSFTAGILPQLDPAAKYFAVEIDPVMADKWQARFPEHKVHVESAGKVAELCRAEGIDQVDVIVSGLPWALFPEALQLEILEATARVLRPGGVFVTFGHHVTAWLPKGRRFHRRLPEYFSQVTRGRIVWRNAPPAFVIRCVR